MPLIYLSLTLIDLTYRINQNFKNKSLKLYLQMSEKKNQKKMS